MKEWDYEQERDSLACKVAGNIDAIWDFSTALGDCMKEKMESLHLKILEVASVMEMHNIAAIHAHSHLGGILSLCSIKPHCPIVEDDSLPKDRIILRQGEKTATIFLINAFF